MSTQDATNLMRAEAELVLNEARKVKAEQTKDLGSPIMLVGKALDMRVRGNDVWIAENAHVAKRISLETGKVLQLYQGHTAPVTCLEFCDKTPRSGDQKVLITGSWDKTIKLWDTETKEILSSTSAHDDFVKTLFVLPKANLLVSGSSDKIVRFWDLSAITKGKPLSSMGSITSHTRPVESIDGIVGSDGSVTLFTADTMGIIKIWNLEKESGDAPRWRSTLKEELSHHRTRVNELLYGNEQLWTASSDETVQIVPYSMSQTENVKAFPAIAHPVAVRAVLPLSLTGLGEPYVVTGFGDIIRLYDVSTLEEPEILGEIDAHWHDVTALRLWMRTSKGEDGKTRIEPWIVSTSLDGTIRKWRFSELLNSKPENPAGRTQPVILAPVPQPKASRTERDISEEEERELAELMGSDSD